MATPIEVKVTPVSPDTTRSTRSGSGGYQEVSGGIPPACHPAPSDSDSAGEESSLPSRSRRNFINTNTLPTSGSSLSNDKHPIDEYDFGDKLLNNNDKNGTCVIKTSTPLPHGPIIDLKGREVIFAIAVFLFMSI